MSDDSIRTRLYGAAMDAAAWANERCYELAVRFNKLYGWLGDRRDRR